MQVWLAGNDSEFKTILFMIVAGTACIVAGYRAFRNKRNVEDTACSKIASAAQGLVEVQGQAWPTNTIRSVEGRALCYWEIAVQQYKKRGKSSSWVTVYQHKTSDPLIVTDGSASCLIVPEKSELTALEKIFPVHKISQEQRDQLSRSLPEAAAYLSLAGQILGGIFGSNVRIVEKKIMAGAPIYVRGEFSTMSGSVAKAVGDYEGYLGQYAKINAPGFQARMFDVDRNGRISEQEHINGYAFAASAFAHRSEVQTVGMAGHIYFTDQHPLLIADVHEHHLVRRLGLRSFLSLWGGVILLALGIYFAIRNYGL
ncbi:MAG: hypothetical protein EOP09_04825 [Proteobacteria bacterium]|nr:MAG: hypothetical protein EOP09_04825 [Pseudomonadota bacterium]